MPAGKKANEAPWQHWRNLRRLRPTGPYFFRDPLRQVLPGILRKRHCSTGVRTRQVCALARPFPERGDCYGNLACDFATHLN
jgi:hypothetical protein